MSEYFELTFFLKSGVESQDSVQRKVLSFLNLKEGRNILQSHHLSAFSNREVLFDVFEESDFYEFRICIADFFFVKSKYDKMLQQLLDIVDGCFNISDSILFATGVYELTYYYTSNVRKISEFNDTILKNFPFVFLKSRNLCDNTNLYNYSSVFYLINTGKDVQDVFSEE